MSAVIEGGGMDGEMGNPPPQISAHPGLWVDQSFRPPGGWPLTRAVGGGMDGDGWVEAEQT